jgi:beta-glucosidase
LKAVVRRALAIAGIPVILTQNGIGTADATQLRAYVERALRGVARCLADGLDVSGYTHWSALDNFEWMLGYRPKFGLIAAVARHSSASSNRARGGWARLPARMGSRRSAFSKRKRSFCAGDFTMVTCGSTRAE